MSMFYDPQLVRALTCERIRDARGGVCVDGQVFELPERENRVSAAFRKLFDRRPVQAETCGDC